VKIRKSQQLADNSSREMDGWHKIHHDEKFSQVSTRGPTKHVKIDDQPVATAGSAFDEDQTIHTASVFNDATRRRFNMETMGGDASLLHLAQQIDAGIRKKMRSIESPRAKRYRQCHNTFYPLKFLMLLGYILLTQFERPKWCLELMKSKEVQTFDENSCNDA